MKVAGHAAYRFTIFEFDQDGYHYYLMAGTEVYEIDFVDPRTIGELTPDVQQRCMDLFRNMLASFSFE